MPEECLIGKGSAASFPGVVGSHYSIVSRVNLTRLKRNPQECFERILEDDARKERDQEVPSEVFSQVKVFQRREPVDVLPWCSP